MAGQQIPSASEPRQECGERDQVKGRNLTAVSAMCCRRMPSAVNMDWQSMSVKVRNVEMRAAGQEHQYAKKKPHDKADQIEINPRHSRPPLLPLRPFVLERGCKASSNRSARPGVSRTAPSNNRHFRVSFSRAALIRTSLNSGSFANRSEPCSSQTSSLPSTVRRSEVNSVW